MSRSHVFRLYAVLAAWLVCSAVWAGRMAGAAPCGVPGGTPSMRVSVPLGKSTNLELSEPVRMRALGNPAVVQIVQLRPKTLYLLGANVGSTNLFIQSNSGRCSLVDLTVQIDVEGLRELLKVHLPHEAGIKVGAAAHAPVLSGTVSDSVAAEQVLQLARQYLAGIRPVATAGMDKRAGEHDTKVEVINLLRVAAPQQVMLEVKVAEVSKNLMSQLGIDFNFSGGIGNLALALTSTLLDRVKAGSALAIGGSKAKVKAGKSDDLIKVLAEPNLVAISGQQAQFLAGGKVFMPVPQSKDTITLQQEPYGVGLTFTPTVLSDGLIHLKVAPEVSELSENGLKLEFFENSWSLPIITTRRAETSVQVYDGQSFAIGGLLKNNASGMVKGVPGLMDLPILGALFRSNEYRNDRTELVFIVTPRLVRGLSAPPPLPTDAIPHPLAGQEPAT